MIFHAHIWITFGYNEISCILHDLFIYGENHVELTFDLRGSMGSTPVYWYFSSDSQTYDLLQYVFSEMTLSEEASAKPR